MKFRITIIAAIVAATTISAFATAGDLYDLLAETPHDAGVIIACADVPAFREQLRDIELDGIILKFLPLLHADVAELYQALSGRLVIAHEFPDDNISIIMDIDPDSEFARRIGNDGNIMVWRVEPEEEGVFSLFDRRNEFAIYMKYDGETLRFSRRRELVADPGGIVEPKITDLRSFIQLVEMFDIESGLIVISPDEQYMPKTGRGGFPPIYGLEPEIQEFMDEFFRLTDRFFKALYGQDGYIAGGYRLDVKETIVVDAIILIRDFRPPDEETGCLIHPQWEAPAVFSFASRSDLIKGIIPALRRGFAAADQEILDEFDEELAEVNEELGFDFERDFIGNLAGDWSFSSWRQSRWALQFNVDDPGAFLRQARSMAELSKELWEEIEGEADGTIRIRTRAYTIPLRLDIDGNRVTLASGDIPLLAEADGDIAARREDGEVDYLRGRYNFPHDRALREMFDRPFDFIARSALDETPADAALELSVMDGDGYRRVTLTAENLDRDDLRRIFGRVKAILDALMM